MQQELNDAQGVRSEIITDFERIRSKVEDASKWEDENKKLKKKNDFITNLLTQIHQKHNKLSLQSFNQLHNIKYKFQQNQRVSSQIDFSRIDKIVQEYAISPNDVSEEDKQPLKDEFVHFLDLDNQSTIRDHQVLELISILTQITNILSFDLTALDLKDQNISDLENQLQELQESKETSFKEYKKKIIKEI